MKKLLAVLSLIVFILISYNFRFEIIYNISTILGYDEYKAKRYSFMFSNKFFEILPVTFKRLFTPQWKNKEEFDTALDLKRNFTNNNSPQLNYENDNYYLKGDIKTWAELI